MVSFRGGSRVGWVNATWPMAKFSVSEDALVFQTGLTTYTFAPEDVVAVERVVWIPVLGWGVRLIHVREDIPARVIFWTLGLPSRVLDAVANVGFRPSASRADMPERRFPFRIPFLLALACAFYALHAAGMGLIAEVPTDAMPNGYQKCATFLLGLVAGGLFFPTPLRVLALRSGGDIRPYRPVLGFIAVIAMMVLACWQFLL